MKIKGTHTIKYVLNKEHHKLIVSVELKQIDGFLKPFQNLYFGIAFVDGKPYKDINLNYCVNAKYCAEKIALRIIGDLRTKYGRKLRIKK